MPASSSVTELLQVRLRLRPELRCTQQSVGATHYFQIEDPLSRRFYRLGEREWQLARRLDGQRSLGRVLHDLRPSAPDTQFDSNNAVKLVRWLVQMQLVTIQGPLRHTLLTRIPPVRAMPSWINPAFMRIPLFNPDSLLARSLPWLSWTLSPLAIAIWCVAVAVAVCKIIAQWDRFIAPVSSILAPNNWLYLLAAWLILKAIHEFYHGLVCRRYGGQVPVCGIALILFSPVAFVDVTSSWKFRSKWHRIFTAAAGMYAELFVASLMVLLWSATGSAMLRQLSYNIIIMASVSTLLFNGNFLMRFDGYYIISDLINVQNLYAGGQQFIRDWTRKHFLGLSVSGATPAGRKGVIVRLYGVASLAWRWLFYIGIVLTAATMFHGAGVVISLVVGTLWILWPAARFVHFLVHGRAHEQPDRLRFAAVGVCLAAVIGVIVLLPWPGGVLTTGVVEYEPLAWVRVESPGFVRALHVRPGQDIKAGTPVVSISNPETQLELSNVETLIQQSEIRSRMLRGEDDYTAIQVEQTQQESLNKQREELASKVAGLRLSAPMEGCVIGRELELLQDQYVDAGTEILAIGSESQKMIVVAVPQRHADCFLKHVGTRPRVRIHGRRRLVRDVTLSRIDPRASERVPHAALAAAFGGPLAVVSAAEHASSSPSGDSLRLVEPHFRAVISLSEDEAERLRAGELARVRIRGASESIGEHVWKTVDRWVRHKLGTT